MTYPVKRQSPQRIEPTKQPSSMEAGWVAGIYEGEGTVESFVQKDRNNVKISVQVTQNDPWILLRLQEFYGGSVFNYSNRKGSGWKITGAKAVEFLEGISPLLSPRRLDQARFHIGRYQSNDLNFWGEDWDSTHFIPNLRSKNNGQHG